MMGDLKFYFHGIPNKYRMTSYSYIPKPILQALGNPDRLKFVIQDGYVEVRGSD